MTKARRCWNCPAGGYRTKRSPICSTQYRKATLFRLGILDGSHRGLCRRGLRHHRTAAHSPDLRIPHPAPSRTFFLPHQPICAAVRKIDRAAGRLLLTHKELLGTWAENAAQFQAGETITGVVRGIKSYGVFIELTPNLTGLAETGRHSSGRRTGIGSYQKRCCLTSTRSNFM